MSLLSLRSMPRRLPFLLVFLVLLVPFWQPLSMLFRMAIESDRYTYIVFVRVLLRA